MRKLGRRNMFDLEDKQYRMEVKAKAFELEAEAGKRAMQKLEKENRKHSRTPR